MKKIISLILASLMIICLFTGCSSTEVQETETPNVEDTQDVEETPEVEEVELIEITLSEVAHSVFYAPQYIAMELGFFEDEGLSVELINGSGADNVMISVLTGEAEIGLAGPEASIYVYLEGSDDYPKIFAQLTNCDGSFLVGRTDEDFDWSNLAGSWIIGGRIGGVPEMSLEYAMRLNGLEPNVDAVVDTSIDFAMMGPTFTAGTGDYVTLFEPTATEVVLAGEGYILCSIGEEVGEMPYTAYFATQEYMTENADVVQAFTNAVAKGLTWLNEHSDEEVAELLVTYFPDTDLDVLVQVAARYREIGAWKDTTVMTEEAFNRLQDVMEQAGELDERVEFTELVDNSFAEKAMT